MLKPLLFLSTLTILLLLIQRPCIKLQNCVDGNEAFSHDKTFSIPVNLNDISLHVMGKAIPDDTHSDHNY